MFQFMLTRQKSGVTDWMQELLTEKEGNAFGDEMPVGRKSPAEGRRKDLLKLINNSERENKENHNSDGGFDIGY